MKRILLSIITACLAGIMSVSAQTVDGRNFGIDGFAAYAGTPGTNHYLAGGTTGGQGGKVVYADNFSQLQAYLQSTNPYIILVDHDIAPTIKCYVNNLNEGKLCEKQDGSEGVEDTYGERIMIASNKTLIGIADAEGRAPLFSHITFVMQCTSNVIIRNCTFTLTGVPVLKSGENKIVAWRDGAQKEVGDPDCIGIQADKNSASTDWGGHIWVDHCSFYNTGEGTAKDRYDGLLDCKNNVKWVTFSYNHFYEHNKACLCGKGNSDNFDRTMSVHHNFYENIAGSRLPLQRFGHMHYCNNYQLNCEDGYDIRKDAIGYVDACYFENTKTPVHGKTSDGGSVSVRKDEGYDIIYKTCDNLLEGYSNIDGYKSKVTDMYTTDWYPTKDYPDYSLNQIDKTADVPEILKKYAGAGKIEIWKTYTDAIPAVDIDEFDKAIKSPGPMSEGVFDQNGKKMNGATTGVQTISITTNNNAGRVVKYVYNGQIVIEKNGKRYTATGILMK